jgi:signal transduction histidine kinase
MITNAIVGISQTKDGAHLKHGITELQKSCSIQSAVDSTIDLMFITEIYDDTFSLYKKYDGIPFQKFKSLNGFVLSKYHKDFSTMTQWLRFKIENKTEATINGYYYCGRHNLISIAESDSIKMQFGGMAHYEPHKSKLFPQYYFPVSLPANTVKQYFVSITNYGILPSPIESKLILSQVNPATGNIMNHYYFGWLIFTCLVCGGILILGIFNFVQFFSNRKPEYLYYGFYALMMFFSIERASEWNFELRIISQTLPNYFFSCAVMFNVLSGIFYLLFTRHFLDVKKINASIYSTINFVLTVLVIGFIVLCICIFANITSHWVVYMSAFLSFAPIGGATFVAIQIFLKMRKLPLTKYYLLGYAFLFLGAGTNIYINNLGRQFIQRQHPQIIYLEVGVLLEIILFAIGLGYKSRLIEKQKINAEVKNVKLQLDNELNILQLRNRLSRDLHDDIGSTLSSINILSRTAQNNLQQTNSEKAKDTLEKISERSQRLLTNMSDIIWNIKPDNDSFEELMNRMRAYATALLEAKKIQYDIYFPAEKTDYNLSIEVKRNLYLIFKEAVNNLAKYSGATQSKLYVTFDNTHIQMKIEDNGAGFNINELKHRGGLSNMQHRAEEINGVLKIESSIGQGTTIELSLHKSS